MTKRRVVLLGIGHTNAEVLRRWIDDPIPNADLVCISRFDFSTYSGMLPGTLAGQFRHDEMQIDLVPLAKKARADLKLAEVTGLDADRRMLLFSDSEPLPFDALSVGVGSIPAGCRDVDSAAVVPIKPMQTFLERLQDRLSNFKPDRRPHKVLVVGGGVAGVEIALCFQARLAADGISDQVSIEIITGGDEIADGLRPRSIRLLRKLLGRRGISVRTDSRIVEVTDQSAVTEDGTEHRADTLIWATGAAAPPVLTALGLPTDKRGFLETDSTLRTTAGLPIFVVGDSGTIVASPFAKAGVYAVRQAPILWHNLNATLGNKPLIEFQPQSDFLKILNTGQGKALLQYKWLSLHARWCMLLKTRIDKRFVGAYQVQA